jgi:translocation protein SEC62
MSPQDYVNMMRAQAMKQAQMQQQQPQQPPQKGQAEGHSHDHSHGGHQHTHEQQVPINPGEPTPQALALQKWLRNQDLKSRSCVLNDQRKDMFKGTSVCRSAEGDLVSPPEMVANGWVSVKRAIRAIQSPAYAAASAKNPTLLPPVTDRASAEEVFKLLPLSLLALRVSKIDPHDGHDHGAAAKPKKRTKGLWTVKIEQQQDIRDELHYIWLQDGPQWRTKLYAAGALLLIMTVVLFPLWPIKLRIGVWYLSMGMLGLIGLFFGMAIFRLILFCITVVAVPPGLWLYPNLFEDVGFFDSFRPLWGWQEVCPLSPSSQTKIGREAIGSLASLLRMRRRGRRRQRKAPAARRVTRLLRLLPGP